MDIKPIGLCMVSAWDHEFLEASLGSLNCIEDRFVFISRFGWDGGPVDCEKCRAAAESANATVVMGDWPNEALHRKAALEHMRASGYRHVLIVDSDELVSVQLLEALLGIASLGLADVVRARMATYFLSPTLRIRPDEALAPIVLVDCQK